MSGPIYPGVKPRENFMEPDNLTIPGSYLGAPSGCLLPSGFTSWDLEPSAVVSSGQSGERRPGNGDLHY